MVVHQRSKVARVFQMVLPGLCMRELRRGGVVMKRESWGTRPVSGASRASWFEWRCQLDIKATSQVEDSIDLELRDFAKSLIDKYDLEWMDVDIRTRKGGPMPTAQLTVAGQPLRATTEVDYRPLKIGKRKK